MHAHPMDSGSVVEKWKNCLDRKSFINLVPLSRNR